MPELHVRNLPAEVHERLREQAASEGRSMSAEAVILLRQALRPAVTEKRQSAIERLREIRDRTPLPVGVAPSEQLVREDRDTTR